MNWACYYQTTEVGICAVYHPVIGISPVFFFSFLPGGVDNLLHSSTFWLTWILNPLDTKYKHFCKVKCQDTRTPWIELQMLLLTVWLCASWESQYDKWDPARPSWWICSNTVRPSNLRVPFWGALHFILPLWYISFRTLPSSSFLKQIQDESVSCFVFCGLDRLHWLTWMHISDCKMNSTEYSYGTSLHKIK